MVYVIAKDNSPLMPTENHAKVRVLLKTGRAKVLRRTPFTIRLLYDTEHGVQETVHILLKYKPDMSISYIASQLKQRSTYSMWLYHTELLKRNYWKRQILWSDGYFACSIGQVSQKTIEHYIQNQG